MRKLLVSMFCVLTLGTLGCTAGESGGPQSAVLHILGQEGYTKGGQATNPADHQVTLWEAPDGSHSVEVTDDGTASGIRLAPEGRAVWCRLGTRNDFRPALQALQDVSYEGLTAGPAPCQPL